MKRVEVDLAGIEIGFEEAFEMAEFEAARLQGTSPDKMTVLAWYDRRSKRSSPEVGFGEGKVLSWVKCGISRGADIWVEVGSDRFIFLCGSLRRH